MEAGQFERITVPSLVDECHRRIKEQILSGELRAGQPLKDSLLAQAMGISRSPVREALRRFEQSGLVVKSANQSYRVVEVDVGDAAELALCESPTKGWRCALSCAPRSPSTRSSD